MKEKELELLLTTPSGLERLIGVDENDHVEFKVTLNHREAKFADELRADCGALSTAGFGFLVVGIDESRDGNSRAVAVVGLEKGVATSLKCSIEDTLGAGLDPPLGPGQRHVWTVDLDPNRSVIVAHVRGRLAYPVAVETKDGASKFYVREAGKKKLLKQEDARLRRRDQDRKPAVRATVGAMLLALLALGGTAAFGHKNVQLEGELVRFDHKNAQLEDELVRQRVALDEQLKPRQVDVPSLAARLRPLAGTAVQMECNSGDTECQILAGQIQRALTSAGLVVSMANCIGGAPVVGVEVQVSDSVKRVGDLSPAAIALHDALCEQRIGAKKAFMTYPGMQPGQFRLYVGSKGVDPNAGPVWTLQH
jgi:hypothetical protein